MFSVAKVAKHVMSGFRIVLLGAPLLLAACQTSDGLFKENKMPTGYGFHGSPKMQPETQTGSVHEEGGDGADKTAASGITTPVIDDRQMWNQAANDLLRQMVMNFGQPVEPVILKSVGADSAMMDTFRNALQVAMLTHGFNETSVPGAGPFILQYSISDITGETVSLKILALTLLSGNDVVSEESGVYTVGSNMPVQGQKSMKARTYHRYDTPPLAPVVTGEDSDVPPMQISPPGSAYQ